MDTRTDQERERDLRNQLTFTRAIRAEEANKKPGHECVDTSLSDSAKSAAGNAWEAVKATAPIVTGQGVSLLTAGGSHGSLIRMFGIPFTIGGIVIDVVKAPFCLAFATEEAGRATLTGMASLIMERNPKLKFEQRVLESFLMRMLATAKLMVELELVDGAVMQQRLDEGQIDQLIGLTFLHTAFASRDMLVGIRLANGNEMHWKDVPEEGKDLFKLIENTRDIIKNALSHVKHHPQREKEESRIACDWIRLIVKGETLTEANSNATAYERQLVNEILTLIRQMSIHGKVLLPENAAAEMKRMKL